MSLGVLRYAREIIESATQGGNGNMFRLGRLRGSPGCCRGCQLLQPKDLASLQPPAPQPFCKHHHHHLAISTKPTIFQPAPSRLFVPPTILTPNASKTRRFERRAASQPVDPLRHLTSFDLEVSDRRDDRSSAPNISICAPCAS